MKNYLKSQFLKALQSLGLINAGMPIEELRAMTNKEMFDYFDSPDYREPNSWTTNGFATVLVIIILIFSSLYSSVMASSDTRLTAYHKITYQKSTLTRVLDSARHHLNDNGFKTDIQKMIAIYGEDSIANMIYFSWMQLGLTYMDPSADNHDWWTFYDVSDSVQLEQLAKRQKEDPEGKISLLLDDPWERETIYTFVPSGPRFDTVETVNTIKKMVACLPVNFREKLRMRSAQRYFPKGTIYPFEDADEPFERPMARSSSWHLIAPDIPGYFTCGEQMSQVDYVSSYWKYVFDVCH